MEKVLLLVLAIMAAGEAAGGQQHGLESALALDYLINARSAAAYAEKQQQQQYRSLPTTNMQNKNTNKSQALVVPGFRQRQQAEFVEDPYDPAYGYVHQITGDIYNGATTAVQTVVDTALVQPIKSLGAIFKGILTSLEIFFETIGLGNLFSSLLSGLTNISESLGLPELLTAIQPAVDKVVEVLDNASWLYNTVYRWSKPLQIILALEDDFLPFLKAFRLVAFASCLWENKYGFIDGIFAGLYGLKSCSILGIGLIPGLGTASTVFGMGVDILTFIISNYGTEILAFITNLFGGGETSAVGDNNLMNTGNAGYLANQSYS